MGTRLKFYSDESAYVKLVDETKQNYTFWEQKCRGNIKYSVVTDNNKYFLQTITIGIYFTDLGHGWGPAVIDSLNEVRFIQENQKRLTDERSYWIGGSTNSEPGIITYADYLLTATGNLSLNNTVFISTCNQFFVT